MNSACSLNISEKKRIESSSSDTGIGMTSGESSPTTQNVSTASTYSPTPFKKTTFRHLDPHLAQKVLVNPSTHWSPHKKKVHPKILPLKKLKGVKFPTQSIQSASNS